MARTRNVVVLHADALVAAMIGGAGDRAARTPHIDALQRDGGIAFDNAYACNGVCVPSRASLMTGRYPLAHGVVNNNIPLPPGEETMGRLFAAVGYATGYFGKTHFGWDDTAMPAQGWAESFLWHGPYNEYLARHGVPVRYPEKQPQNNRLRYWPVGRSRIPLEHYFEKVMADRAIEFIRCRRGGPFLCFYAAIAPHGPFTPPAPYDEMYSPGAILPPPRFEDELDGKPPATVRWVRQNRLYLNDEELRIYLAAVYGLVSLFDDCVGRIVAALREEGLYDDTLILLTSDHGDFAGRFGVLGKSWSGIEHLMRVPLVLSLPGGREAGRRSAALTDTTDVLPTLLDYAGIAAPAKMQGASLLPVARGERAALREAAYAYGQFEYSGGMMAQSMVRSGDWKLLRTQEGFAELYDLARDPWERRNLAGETAHRERLAAMERRLLDWHLATAGGFFRVDRAAFWEDETCFYDAARFRGERIAPRGAQP
jgi:arylsulfatase A-like enzyme